MKHALWLLLAMACSDAPSEAGPIEAPAIEAPVIEAPPIEAPVIPDEAPATGIDDPCLAWSPVSLVHHVPRCDVHETEHFHPWPANVVELPAAEGLGLCHDARASFPAVPVEGCERGRVLAVGELDLPAQRFVLPALEGSGPITVQLFLDDVSPVDWAPLTRIADQIVALFVHLRVAEDDPPVRLDALPSMPHLRTLVVEVGERAIEGLASLTRHPSLEGLGLYGRVSPGEAATLTGLHLRDLGWSGNHPNVLARLVGIESLRIAGSVPNLRAIREWTSLRSLVLLGATSDLALRHALEVPSLDALSVSLEALGPSSIRALAARRWTTLIVRVPPEGFGPPTVVDDGPFELEPTLIDPWTTFEPLLDVDTLMLDAPEPPLTAHPRWQRWLRAHGHR